MWIFEFFAPVIELVGYSTILAAALLGVLGRQFLILFLLFGYAFATLISIGSVLLEEMTYRRYSSWREVARLLLFGLLEHVRYRHMPILWSLRGIRASRSGDVAARATTRPGMTATAL